MKSSVQELLTKLAEGRPGDPPVEPVEETTVSLTDPTFVEKLASAVDYSIDHLSEVPGGIAKTAAAVPAPAQRTSLSHALNKMKEKRASTEDTNRNSVIQTVLLKLSAAAAEQLPEEEEVEEQLDAAPEDSDTLEGDGLTDLSDEDLDGLTLSDVLRDALGASEQSDSLDSAAEPQAETAEVRDNEAGNRMRGLLVKRLKLIAGGKEGA